MIRTPDGSLRFSPGDLVSYLKGDFAAWCDRAKAESDRSGGAGTGHLGWLTPDAEDEELELVSLCPFIIEEAPRGAEFVLSPNRLNVAISRAQALAIVVGSPDLANARCRSVEEMRLVNLLCRLIEYAAANRSVSIRSNRRALA